MFRYFIGSKNRVAYYSYSGSALVGGAILSKYRMYHSNDTELMLAVL